MDAGLKIRATEAVDGALHGTREHTSVLVAARAFPELEGRNKPSTNLDALYALAKEIEASTPELSAALESVREELIQTITEVQSGLDPIEASKKITAVRTTWAGKFAALSIQE